MDIVETAAEEACAAEDEGGEGVEVVVVARVREGRRCRNTRGCATRLGYTPCTFVTQSLRRVRHQQEAR